MAATHHTRTFIAASLLTAVAAISTAPSGYADPISTLAEAVNTARAASNCPPLQRDTLVERGAQMANKSTSDYINLRSAAVPFTDPMPALKTIGYPGEGKGLVLAGYGVSEADALRALILQYRAFKPDCSYTQAGVDAMRDPAGFNLASAVLTAPA
ncbi:hypothetical protein ACQI4L_03165 [Mycolicibacterium litorale]|uniref:hypothetical protein n=1 Tax=Mycolicibacterium litorale TaxID=758802 RepID=UPI003CE9A418